MSLGQTKLSEYFSKRKNCDGLQPSKLRKVVVDEEVGSGTVATSATPPVGSRTRSRISQPSCTITSRREGAKNTRSRKNKTSSKLGAKPANQQTINFTLKKAFDKAESRTSEAVPSAVCDNHSASPPSSPTKRTIRGAECEATQLSRKRGRRQDAVSRDLFGEEAKPSFDFATEDAKTDRVVLSPRRLSTDGDKKSPVFQFQGKEKNEMKESKLKELVRDFTLASENIAKSEPATSSPEVGKCQKEQGEPVIPEKIKGKRVEKPALSIEKLKEGALSAVMNPAALRAKLSKCANLSELKEKLKMLHPPSPQKRLEHVSIQSPVKSHLTDAVKEATAKISSSPSKVKKPAYERFASVEEPVPPGLTLPKTYKLLLDMFIGMDTVVSILHKRAEVCTFSKLKVAIQQMTRRNFELKHLGQIKTVYPTAYNFKQEKNLPRYGKKKSNECQLTVEVNLVDDPLSKNSDITVLTNDGRPDFTTAKIVERKSTFHRKLVDIVRKHHKVFLSSLDPPMSIPDHKVTHWHPKFCVENVPEIKPAELPKAENVSVITTAKDALEQVKKFSNNARVKQALEKVAANSERNVSQNKVMDKVTEINIKNKTETNVMSLKLNTNVPSKPDVKEGLKGVSQSLLEKIRAKEARKQQEVMLRSPADEKKHERMSRLPELVRILRTLFVTSKKPALLKSDVLEKLADSYKACMGEAEAECHLALLTELVPDWISVLKLKRGVYITLDKNKDINRVIETLNKLRREVP